METADNALDDIIEFEVNIRHDLHSFIESSWPEFDEISLLESAVIEASESLQVSKEMAFNSALGAMSTACQGRIQVQQPTGNIVNTNLMLLTIAESGERKTTVEKQFFKSIREVQARDAENAKRERILYEQNHEIWLTQMSALTSELKQEQKKLARDTENETQKQNLQNIKNQIITLRQAEPTPTVSARFIYDDTTPQALVRMMHEHYRHACLLSSEANGIFNGRAFEDLHLLNSLWDGMDIHVDRTSKPSFVLSNARLTLALMTQMQVIETFLSKRGEEARGLGFLARFLVVRPPHLAGDRNATVKLSDLGHLKTFNARVETILLEDINQQNALTKEERDKKTILTFSSKAAQYWDDRAQAIESAQKEGQVYEFYRDHASKLMDNISRMAGIIHYFHYPDKPQIEHATLKYAYQLGMRYSKHFLNYIADEPALIKNAKALIAYLYQPPAKNEPDSWDSLASDRYNDNKNWKPEPCFIVEGVHYRTGRTIKFTAREIRQYGPSMLRDSQKLYRVIDLLSRMGFIKQQEKGRKTHWEFNEALVHQTQKLKSADELHPELKNGHEYSISLLPLFEQIECIAHYRIDHEAKQSLMAYRSTRFKEDKDLLWVLIRCNNAEKD